MGKNNTLTLYRRHTKSCTNTKPTYYPAKSKDRRADNCGCPIVATGYLAFEPKRIQHLSLGTNDWTQAHSVSAELLKAGRIPRAQTDLAPKSTAVEYAVDRYLTGRIKGAKPISPPTQKIFEGHLHGLLIPFCRKHRIVNIKDFELRDVSARFVETWINTRTGEPLAIGTKRLHMQVFRAFLAFCVNNDWIKKNTAKLIPVESPDDEDDDETKRHGLEIHEYQQNLATLDSYPNTLETRRLRALVELVRWCGLRISDAVKFNQTEVKRNENGGGFNANFIQQKTGKRCVSPIPNEVYELLQNLPHDGECDGKRYWFKDCVTVRATQHWETEIARLFEVSQEQYGTFAYRMTPHSLRHTFAIQHLSNGTNIKFVSKWLGHKSIKTTEKYYSRWIKSTVIESEYEALRSFEETRRKIAALNTPNKVVAIRQDAAGV